MPRAASWAVRAPLGVDHGAEVRVVVEHGDPELGSGFLWVEGTYERDSRDMDFVRTGARLGAFVALGSAAILASVSLARSRLRTC